MNFAVRLTDLDRLLVNKLSEITTHRVRVHVVVAQQSASESIQVLASKLRVLRSSISSNLVKRDVGGRCEVDKFVRRYFQALKGEGLDFSPWETSQDPALVSLLCPIDLLLDELDHNVVIN